ncbi:PIN domain-containing protein [Sphingomonas sp. 1P06PA]|uniref:type II toxin-antitoxin system VapC family toxin n=1 Tax=Sphingomonas sp. 1P06PA TaxID=554121 RepID=UPI0039A5A6C0
MKPKRLAWDSCAWIATIIQEKSPLADGGVEDRAKLCNHVIELAAAKKVEIATSGLSLTEVCRGVANDDHDAMVDFFRNEYIVVVPVDHYVGTIGRKLMLSGYAGLKPPDAIHLASALACSATEFHTFDAKLLKLDGKIPRLDTGYLHICKPTSPPPTLF